MTTALDDWAPEDSTGASERMSSARGTFPLGPVPELLFKLYFNGMSQCILFNNVFLLRSAYSKNIQ